MEKYLPSGSLICKNDHCDLQCQLEMISCMNVKIKQKQYKYRIYVCIGGNKQICLGQRVENHKD